MKQFQRSILTATIALAFAAGPALAQQATDPAQPQAQPAPAAAEPRVFSEQEIENFANAYKSVAELQATYQQRISTAEDQEQAQELQIAAQNEMLTAVEEEDLDPQTFNEISAAMQTDPELMAKVQQKLAD